MKKALVFVFLACLAGVAIAQEPGGGEAIVEGASGGAVTIGMDDDVAITYGDSDDAVCKWDTTLTPDAFVCTAPTPICMGATADSADYATARMISSQADTGDTSAVHNIGIVGEAVSVGGSLYAEGVRGVGLTDGANTAMGVAGYGRPGATGDTGICIGVLATAAATHAGGDNVAVQAWAANGANNYAVNVVNGDIKTGAAADWELVDDNANALSFDSDGKAEILNLSTVNGSEGVSMSGTLAVTGSTTSSRYLATASGSKEYPNFAFSNSDDGSGLGLYSAAQDTMTFTTDGANNMTINKNGQACLIGTLNVKTRIRNSDDTLNLGNSYSSTESLASGSVVIGDDAAGKSLEVEGASFYKGMVNFIGSSYAASSPAQITSDEDDYALPTGGTTKLRMTTDASRTITGIVPTRNGESIFLINVGSFDLVLGHEDASSTAANRMISPTGADLTIGSNEYAYLWHDSTTSRWRILDTNGA